MAGEAIGYYEFFPVQDDKNQQDWGRVPTWGTCTVVASTCSFVPKGQRVYGMVPLSRYLVAAPIPSKSGDAWVDSAPHRQKRDIVYNTYSILDKDPMYPGPSYEDAMILVRPLFLTAWLLREAVALSPMETLVITSASSKTGASLAALIKRRRETTGSWSNLKIVGMTSPGNVQYCASLGYFDEIITYTTSLTMKKVVIVDMAGKLDLLRGLQATLKESLVKIISVGMTHVAEADMGASFSGEGFDSNYAKPEFFFAPKYAAVIAKKDPSALTITVARDWRDFIETYPLDIQRCETVQHVGSVLQDFIHGRVPGNISWIGSLRSDGVSAFL
jgi:hypothetical protein